MQVEENSSIDVWNIQVRSAKLPNGQVSVPIRPESELFELVSFINEVLSSGDTVEIDFTKLIHKGKSLDLSQQVQNELHDGDTVLLVYSSRASIEKLRISEKIDSRIRSFEDEEKLHEKRKPKESSFSFWGEEQDAQYRFVKFEICSRFVTPHPFEAEKLLIKLATDPGVKKVMKKYKWTVGTLAEMDPKSDLIAQRKEAEGSCLLGYNENAGHKIYLRLRTDDELNFRGYDGLVNTLLHELTHNVRSPHDEEFWKIFGQLKAEYLKFHETEYNQGSSTARRVINAQSSVDRALRNQAGNSALDASERTAASSVLQSQRQVPQVTSSYIPTRLGATNSRARTQEREKLVKAIEARQKTTSQHEEDAHEETCNCSHQQKHEQPQVEETSKFVKLEETDKNKNEDQQQYVSDKEPPAEKSKIKKYLEPSPIGMDEENTSERERRIREAVIRLCRNQNEESAKLIHLIIKNALTKEAKYRTVKASSEKFKSKIDSAGMFLLESVGFEREGDSLVLKRDDPGLLILGKLLLEESNLVV